MAKGGFGGAGGVGECLVGEVDGFDRWYGDSDGVVNSIAIADKGIGVVVSGVRCDSTGTVCVVFIWSDGTESGARDGGLVGSSTEFVGVVSWWAAFRFAGDCTPGTGVPFGAGGIR